MNVEWRKMGKLILAAGGAISLLCITATTSLAQSADNDQVSPAATNRPSATRASAGNSADGWHDGSANQAYDSDSRMIDRQNSPPTSQPTEPPRAGSPGYAPRYQQRQSNSGRANATRPQTDPRYRPMNHSSRDGQYVDPRQQSYRHPPAGSTNGPYFGYPTARARMASYDSADSDYAGDSPAMTHVPSQSVMSGPMQAPPNGSSQMEIQGQWSGPEQDGGCAGGNCAAGCSSGGCSSCGCDDCWGRRASCMLGNWFHQDAFRDFSVYAGVQGFKDPIDLGNNGDFGFHEGVNWGMPLWGCSGVGVQMGFEFDHSDLAPNANVFGDHRNQYFITGGLFYRPTRECGWQGGLVWDYLNDEFYDSVTVGQIRGNLSYVIDWSEVGFEFAANVHSDQVATPPAIVGVGAGTLYRPADLYTVYYGRRLANGGEIKLYGGLANGLGAIVGSNLDIAISDSFSLEGDFSYVIADQVAAGSVPGESANLAFSIVWHPGCHARDTFDSAYRPLFNVADNSTFIVNRRTLP